MSDSVLDPVAGVLSRRFFDLWIAKELVRCQRYGRPLSLGFAAVDRMSRWNERRGREAGDRILRTVGELLERTCRASDVVARYDGDTFAVVLPETDLFSAREVAAMLCLQVARHDWDSALDGDEPVTVSVGVVAVDPAQNLSATVEKALRHLERARTTGRNRVYAGA